MHVIEVDVINRARLAVAHDNAPADQLLLGSMQFGEDVHGALVAGTRAGHARENSADGSQARDRGGRWYAGRGELKELPVVFRSPSARCRPWRM